MLPQIHQEVMNSWKILEEFLKEEEMVRYSIGWNPLSSKPQKEDKLVPCQKEGGKQERSPSRFYQKASGQQTSPIREKEQEKELKETIFPKMLDFKNAKRFHGKCL
ncbi:hypothetical protein O181_050822 [Austropuccinia psidii MF-1]|uniref:Uncharacterized protein n=1 Tax=Austropuccinia psidii MF-1 TaxID=1389203 RepID=A0A9Q3HNY3_9BASI|nr:hypothetical protein [Austropuccinia psidii MF-1]